MLLEIYFKIYIMKYIMQIYMICDIYDSENEK